MSNPMLNPQPNYSGVTIQIANPTVNAGAVPPPHGYPVGNSGYTTCPQIYCCPPQYYGDYSNAVPKQAEEKSDETKNAYPPVYPAEYYINDYGKFNGQREERLNNSANSNESTDKSEQRISSETINRSNKAISENYTQDNINSSDRYSQSNRNTKNEYTEPDYSDSDTNSGANAVLKHYDDGKSKIDGDLSKSTSIIGDIDERETKIKEEKKNAKESKIVALTDEYIKSLENYLNNPNDEIRLMASKEILTRLDEDKDRYNDAALNALLNKMLQDPSKLVRIAALSAFGSQLASGNDYTVQLLHNIQANPSADKEDVLQAADILLKMSAGTEVKSIPNPDVKDNKK